MANSDTTAPAGAPSPVHLESLLDRRRATIYSAVAILGHALEALDTHADPINGSVNQNDACDVQYSIRGAQKLLQSLAESLEWVTLADDAAALGRAEEADKRMAEREGAQS